MSKKIGIIGLGIGGMYYKILHNFFDVITVDIDPGKNPMYTRLEDCLKDHKYFDLFIVATPNYLHFDHVLNLIPVANVILVEKPGFKTMTSYISLYNQRQNVFMTKNNLWREEFPFIRNIILNEYYKKNIEKITINWINKSRVPFPGHWFTEKEKAWGGTSRDSFPHLLSEFYFLFGGLYNEFSELLELVYKNNHIKRQNFTLDQVTDTDYGTVKSDGIFDVDDYCELHFHSLPVSIIGCWKSPTNEDTKIGIEMKLKDGNSKYFPFDLCPEYAYFKQFNYFLNLTEEERKEQHRIDLFIHSIIERL